ncbi:MAG: D-aminoacyl-tRNA deacylase [Candidatus Sulfomarinibacteraceae bacterium]
MKMVIQRVTSAAVRVGGETVGSIDHGLLVLVGLEKTDGDGEVEQAARRLATLRVFEDDAGKMNRGLDEVGGEVLAVSQFTLAGSIRKGRRPSFDGAMPGAEAEPLFNRFVQLVRERGIEVSTGVFGAMMEVELINEGPVTFILEL